MTEIQTTKVRPEWADIMNDMVKIDLDMARWRAKAKTDWGQLGLPAAAFEKAYTPGMRLLLPERVSKELDLLEQIARELLDRMSFKTLFGQLISKPNYFEFKQRLSEMPIADLRRYLYNSKKPLWYQPGGGVWDSMNLQARWFQLSEEIALNRDVIVNEVANLYDDALQNIWRREHDIIPRDRVMTGAEQLEFLPWLDEKKTALVACIPTAAAIRSSFILNWTLAEVETPPEVIKAAKMEALEARETELRTALSNAQTERDRLELQRQSERLQLDRAIADEVARTRNESGKRFEAAIDQIVGQLQGEIYGMTLDLLENLDAAPDTSGLHSRSIGRIKNLVGLVQGKLVGLTNDTGLKAACAELERLADSGLAAKADYKPEVERKLRQIAIDMKCDLIAAGVPSRSGRNVGVPDDLESISVTRGERAPLALELGGENTVVQRQTRHIAVEIEA